MTPLRAAECPRCGYDLSGETSRWVECCPLRGRCPECGLDFEWEHVLVEARTLPWFVEEGRRRRNLAGAAIGTWRRAFLPRRFWLAVTLERAPVPRRLVIWLLVVLGIPYAVVAAARILPDVQHVVGAGATPNWQPLAGCALWPLGEVSWDVSRPNWRWEWVSCPTGVQVSVVIAAMMPVMLLVLPWTRAVHKVRAAHVARAAVYSLSCFGVLALVFALAEVLRAAGELMTGFGLTTGAFRGVHRVVTRSGWTLGQIITHEFTLWHIAASLWVLVWWWRAVSVGFRMERFGRIYLVMAGASLLAALVVFVASWEFAWMWAGWFN